jgi:hypothetical protein
MARSDDTENFDWDETMPNPHFNFALLTKLCWSKNAHGEQAAPEQTMLAAGNWKFCTFLGLATWLELWIGSGTGLGNNRPFA